RQIGSVLSSRTLNLELVEQNRQLEVEHARQIVMQRDLIRAKDQVDDELMRFKSIQEYIAKSLDAESDDEFFQLTLEAIIEAFELEIAVFLQVQDEASGRMNIVSQFGLDDVPDSLPVMDDWFVDQDSQVVAAGSDMLEHWPGLGLGAAIVCPFRDSEDKLGGIIIAGITADSMDFYEDIRDEIRVPYSVLVRQAGGLWINRQLNAEILAHNRRLASLTDSYSRFVPFQFLDLLGRASVEDIITGDSALRDMSVLFADIRGFTTLSEQLGPTESFIALNEFLATMEPLIADNNGFINQYLGDAVMALFPESADGALRCAEAMLETQRVFNRARETAGKQPIFFGLGINSGPLMIGALGGGERLDSNVIGDTVNLASRTEGLTKIYGVPAIFTEDTHTLLRSPETLKFREIDRVIVKGRATATTIYELLHRDLIVQRANTDQFAAGLDLYRRGEFAAAMDQFRGCLSHAPDDPVARLYVERCRGLQENSPANWNGVWSLDEKD
ncbi:MAG: adenylate/guanylate cyclase domain-containing protein, partial [Proteobacteria bacterium]|nr:adenylate/guanylate cyclase domain-containing protein [Pseudomonadota bacterium]